MQAFRVVQPLAWPIGIAAAVAAIVNIVVARVVASSREELRQLRVALEQKPTPAQLGQAMRLWPDIAQVPEALRLGEMVKRGAREEAKKVERIATWYGFARLFATIVFLAAVVIVAGMFWKPGN
jgi:hypothetical protein